MNLANMLMPSSHCLFSGITLRSIYSNCFRVTTYDDAMLIIISLALYLPPWAIGLPHWFHQGPCKFTNSSSRCGNVRTWSWLGKAQLKPCTHQPWPPPKLLGKQKRTVAILALSTLHPETVLSLLTAAVSRCCPLGTFLSVVSNVKQAGAPLSQTCFQFSRWPTPTLKCICPSINSDFLIASVCFAPLFEMQRAWKSGETETNFW